MCSQQDEICFVMNHNEIHVIQESCQENVFDFDHHSLQYTWVFDSPIYDGYNDLNVKDNDKLHG